MCDCSAFIRFLIASVTGPQEWLSPMMSVVTPWRISLCPRPSASSESTDQLSMLMKPGATASPRASTATFAVSRDRSPTAAIVSPRRPMSARLQGAPEPSYTVPPRMRTSNSAARSGTASDRRARSDRRSMGLIPEYVYRHGQSTVAVLAVIGATELLPADSTPYAVNLGGTDNDALMLRVDLGGNLRRAGARGGRRERPATRFPRQFRGGRRRLAADRSGGVEGHRCRDGQSVQPVQAEHVQAAPPQPVQLRAG